MNQYGQANLVMESESNPELLRHGGAGPGADQKGGTKQTAAEMAAVRALNVRWSVNMGRKVKGCRKKKVKGSIK